MKKGLLIVTFLILMAIDITAMSVTLGGPTGTQTTSTINFGCTVTGTEEGLVSLTLWHNLGGTFQENETNSSGVSEGTEYTFTINNVANGNYEWNCKAINDTSEFFAGSNNTFTVNVPTNNNPFYTPIPNQTWPETSSQTITLSDYFTDPDGDSLTYTSTIPANINVSIAGAVATLTPNLWHGTTTITFTANDGKGGTNSTTADLNVTHSNRPPYNKTEYMENVTWKQNEEEEIELDNYFGDYDGDTLTYRSRLSSGGTAHINITIDNSTAEATMMPLKDWKGYEKVIFTAYDGQGGSLDSNEVTLFVKEGTKINHEPEISSHSPLMNPIIVVGNSQKFTIETYDEDLDDLTIKWYLNSSEETTYRNKVNYTFLALSEGLYELRVTVDDGEFSDTKNWTIKVQGIGSPPGPQENQTPTPKNKCGNGMVDAGETCSTCPEDVVCPPDYTCQNEKCIKSVKSSNWKLILIVGGGFLLFAAVVIFVYKIYQRRTIFGGWEPKYTGEAKQITLPEKPKDIIAVEKPKELVKKEDAIPKVDRRKTVDSVLLKHYIQTNMKKGSSIEQIKEKLKKVGWSEEKIEEAYKAVLLDETFKR